jgi:FtsP/CotA-like multicopper oxidase with cupredoxin domain
VTATLAVLGPLGYFWVGSLVPSTYDMSAMGTEDFGGGPAVHAHGGNLSVASLTGPTTGTPAVDVTLTARKQGSRYLVNGTSPGPEIRAVQGQLIQVTLVNDNIADGITLHWHGVDVPNAEDGVAGITQNAVKPGQRYVYRFVAQHAGTYWYHSHQVSHEQVRGGLFGALVVSDRLDRSGSGAKGESAPRAQTRAPGRAAPGGQTAAAAPAGAVADQVVAVHTYDGRRTINGARGVSAVQAPSGATIRARVVNTDAGPIRVWVSGAPFKMVAIDGRDIHGPGDISGKSVLVTAGGRVDLQVKAPARIDVGAGVALAIGSAAGAAPGAPAAAPEPRDTIDPLTYGTPAEIGFDPAHPTRVFDYKIDRRIGFLDGKPGFWWTINGHEFPDVPMFMVQTGDVVRMKIVNSSGEVHPMHLHGHHAVVLSRNGVAATGSPWWIDSLDVGDGDTYEIAFIADNPGIWADHCHNLKHAVDGLLAHLAYAGVSTPYRVGGDSGNHPE